MFISFCKGRQRAISAEFIQYQAPPYMMYPMPPMVVQQDYNQEFPPLGSEPPNRVALHMSTDATDSGAYSAPYRRRSSSPPGLRRSNSMEDLTEGTAPNGRSSFRTRAASMSRQSLNYLNQPPVLPQSALTPATSYTFAVSPPFIPTTITEQREPRRLTRRYNRERSLSPERRRQDVEENSEEFESQPRRSRSISPPRYFPPFYNPSPLPMAGTPPPMPNLFPQGAPPPVVQAPMPPPPRFFKIKLDPVDPEHAKLVQDVPFSSLLYFSYASCFSCASVVYFD